MNKSLASAILLGGACALTASSSSAAIVFSDDFSTDQTSNYDRWNNDGSNDMVVSYGSANQNMLVNVTGTSSNDRTLLRQFSSTSLVNAGDSIKLSVDFYMVTTANPIRFGLYNINTAFDDGTLTTTPANKDGYFAFFYSGATTTANLRRDYTGGTGNIMTASAVGTSPASRPFVSTLATDSENINLTGAANLATFTLTVTKLSDGNNKVEALISKGGIATAYFMTANESDGYGVSTFNTVSLFTFASQTVYDNIRVEFTPAQIPEASSFAVLAGFFAIGTVALRRGSRSA